MLAVGSSLVLAGQLSLGTLVASQGLLLQVLVPAGQLVWLGVLLKAVTSIERQATVVREIPLDPEVRPVVRSDEAPLPMLAEGPVAVGLRDVVFGYDRDAPPLFDGMELEIAAGSRVALVGGSGSGKSTLVRLVIGELQPWSGTVTLDGIPRLDLPRAARTGAVAYVPQSPVVVPGTIRENITLFDRRISAADVAAAIRDARIEDAIGARPHGLDEEITASGHGFSGGELQRLAIARALARQPRLLVLDEATSALDPIVEAEVESHLRERACTTIVVAHRISTVRDAESIVVVDAGRIVQRGRYDELRTVGRFAELIRG
jgi:ABC-type bacteriocin/lantibiotic exporter with double-glycine peptidase domain